MEDLLPINDKDYEDTLVSTIMSDGNAYNEVRDILTEDCFYDYFNRMIFNAVKAISEKGNIPDTLTVKAELDAKGVVYDFVTFITLSGKYTMNVRQYALRLKDLASRRKMMNIALELYRSSATEEVEIEELSQKASDGLASIFSSGIDNIMTLREGIRKVNKIINDNLAPNKELTGTPTGFHALDNKSGGLQGSDLIIVAAESSQGKSSMAMSISINAAKAGAKIAIYSMEMRAEQLTARIMAMESGVSSSNIMYSRLDGGQLEQVEKGIARLRTSAYSSTTAVLQA